MRRSYGLKRALFKPFLISLIFMLFLGSSVDAQTVATLSADTSSGEGRSVGETFTMNILVAQVEDLYAWQLDVRYEPSILRVQRVTEGDFLKQGGPTFFIAGTRKDGIGMIDNVANTFLGSVPGENGQGLLAEITFEVIGKGNIKADLSEVKLRNSKGNPIPTNLENADDLTVAPASLTSSGGDRGGSGGSYQPNLVPLAQDGSTAGGLQLGEIYGRVVNRTWQTIPGTCIRINNTIMPTNPGGEFRFTLVHPGIYTIYYDAPGYIGQTQVIEVKPGQVTRPPTVIMSKGVGASSTTGEIFGKVVNQAGQMIPGTCIRIDATLMPTNPGGEFRFTLVHSGVYTIYYDAPGYMGQTQKVEVAAGVVTDPPTVTLKPVTKRNSI